MGLGLTFGMSIGTEDGAAVLDRFLAALTDRLHATPLGPWADVRRHPDTALAQVSVHPAAQPIEVELRSSLVVVTANTSDVGPGFHRFLVESLDLVARDIGRKSDWTIEDGDETGYATSRDGRRLEHEMLTYFENIAKVVTKYDTDLNLALSMTREFHSSLEKTHVYSPTGRLPRDYFSDALAAGADLEKFARRHFAWWSAGFGTDFEVGLTRSYAWSDCRWTTPRTDVERSRLERAIAVGRSAIARGAEAEDLASVLDELETLSKAGDIRPWPAAGVVGYRRNPVRIDQWAPWSMQIPGCLTEGLEDGQPIYWNEEMVIRATALQANRSGPEHQEPARLKDSSFKSNAPDDGYLLQAEFFSEGNPARLLVLTVWIAREDLRGRADPILQSVTIND